MDFSVLPPEVNSGRMYAGPGAGPMLAAATAWARLAAELGSAGRASESVITELTGAAWLGPAAEAMAAAVAPYAGWLNAVAAQAEQTAARVAAAAGAFDEAFAAVVPPPVIAANRSQWATLVSTNVFGQNSAAIAAADAQYAQMWVQDVVAMHGYAARAAAAASVPPFSPPPPVANPAGSAGQAAAIGNAVAGNTHDQLAQLLAAIPQALHPMASTAGSTAPLADGLGPLQSVTPTLSLSQLASYIEVLPRAIVPFNDAIKTILYGLVQYSRNLTIDLDVAAVNQAAAAGAATGALASAGSTEVVGLAPAVSVSLGNAELVGKLTVPPSWVEAAPVVKMAATALPGTEAAAAAAAGPDIPTGVFADMALASLLGRTRAGTGPRSSPGPAAVMNGHAQGRLERLVTELAGTHDVQHWHVDPTRLDSLLDELAEKPGVHAVHVNDDGQSKSRRPHRPG